MSKFSPMIQQYMDIKKNFQDSILFFRLGDFYEMFFEDANTVSKELDLTLTARKCGNNEKAPMCGVPYHSCEAYIQRLVKKGYKVALCDQDGNEPTDGNKVVDRNIVRVVTPGTILEGNMLDESKNNYICSIFMEETSAAVCFCDVSTGSLSMTYIDEDVEHKILNEIASFEPIEVLINKNATENKSLVNFINTKLSATVEVVEDSKLLLPKCKMAIERHFSRTLEQLNIEDNKHMVFCVTMLFIYLSKTQMSGLENISKIDVYSQAKYMSLDYNSRKNLELCSTLISQEKKGSLLWVLDKTCCPMGKRLIKNWIEQPLVDINEIMSRQDAVACLKDNLIICDDIRTDLNHVHDIERLLTKVIYGSANARDLVSLRDTLELLPSIKNSLSQLDSKMIKDLFLNLDVLQDVYSVIKDAIVDDPPLTVREGGMIKANFNKELDSIKDEVENAADYLVRIENKERERTSIPKLKVAYNRVFGYYIEISNTHKNKVPEDYIRKQTLTNCERYINQELKELEARLLTAKDRMTALEYELFQKILNSVAAQSQRLRTTIQALAKLDVLCSLAVVASKQNYCRPNMTTDGKINIKESRHPVVEKLLKGVPFVPNDVYMDTEDDRLLIITGPNMAGKSTYMRQIALISLMAQIGSFIPAKSADISIVDQIFTRVGASDNLAAGQSTFMLEMNEVADILNKATKDSLIILDEIGRGTSTYDGMSIARAVLEYTADKEKLGAKTLFSTHYHELTSLEGQIEGVRNYNICVKKRGDDITFLRRIVLGGADRSYGVEVAKLAGVPDWVIERAKEVLAEVENNSGVVREVPIIEEKEENSTTNGKQLKILEKVKACDVETFSPIEALNFLYELKAISNED